MYEPYRVTEQSLTSISEPYSPGSGIEGLKQALVSFGLILATVMTFGSILNKLDLPALV